MILVKILFPTCITLNKLVVFRPKPRPSTRDDNLMWVDAGDSRSPPGTRQGSLSRPAGYAQLRESQQHPRPDPRSWRQVLMVLLSLDSSEEVRILIKVRGCHNGICCHDWDCHSSLQEFSNFRANHSCVLLVLIAQAPFILANLRHKREKIFLSSLYLLHVHCLVCQW